MLSTSRRQAHTVERKRFPGAPRPENAFPGVWHLFLLSIPGLPRTFPILRGKKPLRPAGQIQPGKIPTSPVPYRGAPGKIPGKFFQVYNLLNFHSLPMPAGGLLNPPFRFRGALRFRVDNKACRNITTFFATNCRNWSMVADGYSKVRPDFTIPAADL